MLLAALLRAHLHDSLVLVPRLDRERTLADAVAQRLLKVHIFPCLACRDHGEYVPLLIGGNDHCVDVLVLK